MEDVCENAKRWVAKVPYTARELLELLVENKIDPAEFFTEVERLPKSQHITLADLIKEQTDNEANGDKEQRSDSRPRDRLTDNARALGTRMLPALEE